MRVTVEFDMHEKAEVQEARPPEWPQLLAREVKLALTDERERVLALLAKRASFSPIAPPARRALQDAMAEIASWPEPGAPWRPVTREERR